VRAAAERYARLSTHLAGDELVLRDVFATRRIRRDEIERLAVEEVQPAGAPVPYAAGVAVRRDGRRARLPGIAEVRSQPDEPHATLRRLADAFGREPPAAAHRCQAARAVRPVIISERS
jgi:hypothetical protein